MDLRGPKPCTLGWSQKDLRRVIGRVGTRPKDTSNREVLDVYTTLTVYDPNHPFGGSQTLVQKGSPEDPI